MEITGFFASLAGIPFLATIPFVVFILALLVKQPVGKAFEGATKVTIGSLGMLGMSFIAIRLFGPAVARAAQTVGGPMHNMTLIDVGWTNALIAETSPMMWLGILIFIAINVGMILIGLTKTLYVDFPAMWRASWTGLIVWVTSDSFLWGTLAMELFLISDVLLADWNAKRQQTYHEFNPSASFPNSQNAAVIAAPLAWLLARIPGINQLNIKGDWVKKNLTWFAQPMVLGIFTGTLLGLLGWSAGTIWYMNLFNALLIGVAASMMFHVWPMALGVMFDGWAVFNEGMRNILVRWMKGKREVYLAVDTSVLLGHPTVATSTALMYPLAFLLAVFVPGVGLFPVISVQIIQWWMAHITGWTKGNVVHNLIICSVVVILYGWAATAMAEPYTFWVQHMGIMPREVADAGMMVTNWDGGGDLRIWVLYKLASLLP
jgi:PTS system galactitol-specific IIC component